MGKKNESYAYTQSNLHSFFHWMQFVSNCWHTAFLAIPPSQLEFSILFFYRFSSANNCPFFILMMLARKQFFRKNVSHTLPRDFYVMGYLSSQFVFYFLFFLFLLLVSSSCFFLSFSSLFTVYLVDFWKSTSQHKKQNLGFYIDHFPNTVRHNIIRFIRKLLIFIKCFEFEIYLKWFLLYRIFFSAVVRLLFLCC